MSPKLSNYTTFAVPTDDMERVRAVLEKLLGIEMHGVASGAWGDYYTTPNRPRPKISVFLNMKTDEEGPYWTEDEYRDYPLLVSISDAATPDKLNAMISRILSDTQLGAVLVRKTFRDDSGNKVDEHGNLIESSK